jgi:hypothetical protein
MSRRTSMARVLGFSHARRSSASERILADEPKAGDADPEAMIGEIISAQTTRIAIDPVNGRLQRRVRGRIMTRPL